MRIGGSGQVIVMDKNNTEVRTRIRSYLEENFQISASASLQDDTSLLDEGIVDSMGILTLVEFLEGEFGIEVTDDDLVGENFASIDALHAFVERAR